MAFPPLPLDDDASAPAGAVWRVRLLGELVATPVEPLSSNGSDTRRRPAVDRFRTHKTALLLARLALFPRRSHGREELADLLWPEMLPERGRANLTLTLAYLRQAFGESRKDGLFLADHKTIRVAKGLLQTDVAEWEARAANVLSAPLTDESVELLRSCLADYHGDLLPGFYEEWVCDERNRLSAVHDALQDRLQRMQQARQAASSEPARDSSTPASLSPVPATRPSVVANAPLYLTRFFGRARESERAVHLLRRDPPPRLLTLLGTGGIGKTRLALHVAQLVLAKNEADGGQTARFGWVCFAPLAEARTATQIEEILTSVLQIPGGSGDVIAGAIACLNSRAALCAKDRLLLILDNLEQLGEASAPVIARILAEVPALTILATSRQPVGISGEQELLVGSLRGSPVDSDGLPDCLPDDARLFLDRASLIRGAEWERSPQLANDVLCLCALLEGIPLALELAATWTRVFSLPQIIARLDHRFDLLSLRDASKANKIGIPARHRSLHTAICWSYDLLEPPLQTFFARLSVFRGGWTAEAAGKILDVPDAGETLLLLAERSLIVSDESASEGEPTPRYRMLETLREFAHAQLNALSSAHERERLSLRHAAYFDAFTLQAGSLEQSQSRAMRAVLQAERDNLRAAIEFGLQPIPLDTEAAAATQQRLYGLRIFLQSSRMWSLIEAEYFCDLCGTMLPFLPIEARHPVEADFLLACGTNAMHRGDNDASHRHLQASLALCEAAGDRTRSTRIKGHLGTLAYQSGDEAGGITGWRESLKEARELGNLRLQSAMMNNLAIVLPDLDERRRLGEQAVALDRIHVPGSYLLACSLNTLGNAARAQRDYPTARSCYEEGYEVARADSTGGMVMMLQTSLIELYLETGERLDRARDLLDDMQHTFEEQGERRHLIEVFKSRCCLALLHGDAEDALSFARQSLRLSREVGQDPTSVAALQANLSDQLRQAGFSDHAEQFQRLAASGSPSP